MGIEIGLLTASVHLGYVSLSLKVLTLGHERGCDCKQHVKCYYMKCFYCTLSVVMFNVLPSTYTDEVNPC